MDFLRWIAPRERLRRPSFAPFQRQAYLIIMYLDQDYEKFKIAQLFLYTRLTRQYGHATRVSDSAKGRSRTGKHVLASRLSCYLSKSWRKAPAG